MTTLSDIISLTPSELIKWCRERKTTLGYSNQKLSELSQVPIGTIDRIMAGKYTEYKYSSIQPIVATLLGYGEETPAPKDDSKQAQYYYDTIEGFKLVVEKKNNELDEIKKAYDMLLKEKEFLLKENAQKQKQLDWLMSVVDDLKKK